MREFDQGLGDTVGTLGPSGGVVSAAARGHRAAFSEIVEHYEPRLRALVYHLVQDADLTRDTVQESLLRAYRALPGFRGEASVGTWLHRIAYTTALEQLRRRGREAPAGPAPDASSSDNEACETLALREAVRAALAALPAEQRLTLLLVDREGYDYRAVADIMGVSPGTVCSRLQRARAKLRRDLEQHRPSVMADACQEES